jgi:hypothetical protein
MVTAVPLSGAYFISTMMMAVYTFRRGIYFILKTTTPTPHFILTTMMLDPHLFAEVFLF